VVTIGICAHTARSTQAHNLAAATGAQFVCEDDGSLGCAGNHTKAWWQLALADSEWVLLLEDDAAPVDGFRDQLDQALTVSPSPVVSLYLGTSRPRHWQLFVTNAVQCANQADASWITATHLLHCVGVAVKTELAPLMADWSANLDQPLDDHPVGEHTISYCWPSLVDHRDDTPVVQHPDGQPRDQPRTAWRTGTRNTWTDRTVEMI
jgi:GR25 family glycosyltransferase involved in LPS biosynthesis